MCFEALKGLWDCSEVGHEGDRLEPADRQEPLKSHVGKFVYLPRCGGWDKLFSSRV